jgi:hypothetical protein
MTRGFPVYCGRDLRGVGCTQLATVRLTGKGRSTVACVEHRGALEKWVAQSGTCSITPVAQPVDAVAGDGRMTLFDMPVEGS